MSPGNGFRVDGAEVVFLNRDSLLDAMLRAGLHPTGGGCLCCAGDCPHCLATVDGVGYVRTCQVRAASEMSVSRDHQGGSYPPLSLDTPPLTPDSTGGPVRYLHCDVVVIGQGETGRAAAAEAEAQGKSVLALDVTEEAEVIGIYPGPLVVARSPAGMLHVEPGEIVVATGAAEIQPVAPGSDLSGIFTRRAAARLAAAGVELGRVVAIGEPPTGLQCEVVEGTLVRFEGEGSVSAVVVATAGGAQRSYSCAAVSVALGFQPRDVLARMANGIGGSLRVRVIGEAAKPADVPACPQEGIVCPCSQVSVAHLDAVWDRGFREMELVKRATLAGTGTCQGGVCIPYLRSFLADRGAELQSPFTARPLAKQRTLGEIAAGAYYHATPRTALDAEHRRLGAQMERSGGWFRPWRYADPAEECHAVREAVSICDVSTLGKMRVSGPDALELLERLYPTPVSTLKPGRSRYALLLDEKGYVLDDGLICRDERADGPPRYRLTFTSGGSTLAELWMRDWAESWGLDVRLMNQTMSLGAINVTGPMAAELLFRAGTQTLPSFGGHGVSRVAGVSCRIFRLSFTGELSYELHHAAGDSVALWRRLLELGDDLGCRPHGLDALLRLRLEKGHILVGQDTDFDSTPRRIAHEWAVKLDKGDFVGRLSVLRTNRIPLDRQLVGLEMESPAPIEGAVIWHEGEFAGYVTSSTDSPALGRAVMLGWVATVDGDATLPAEVTIADRPARRVATPFYDREGQRARVVVETPAPTASAVAAGRGRSNATSLPRLEEVGDGSFCRVSLSRVVATQAAISELAEVFAGEAVCLRVAADEILVDAPVSAEQVSDPHALVERESGFAAARFAVETAADLLRATCEWCLPESRPAFAQGSVADLPVKLWLEESHVFFLVPEPFALELEQRLGEARS
ncbi:MAG: glycine cleavage T C-terminal barrel domain-containing protein [Acidobacteriota bacterium]|nr:glycine cleavage T C-terminal barrel domain-containing protein [Acidobacteriota bacterium]